MQPVEEQVLGFWPDAHHVPPAAAQEEQVDIEQ